MTSTVDHFDRALEQAKAAAEVPRGTVRYRPATLHDELHVTTLFSRMLRELEPLGHDVLPTEANVDTFWDNVFAPALDGQHGIVLAFMGDTCVGCTFFTPEQSGIETPGKRAVAHGIYVLPEWRRQGVAWTLQQHAHRMLAHFGFTHLLSVVVSGNEAGLRSAAAAGAHVTGFLTTVNLAVEVGD